MKLYLHEAAGNHIDVGQVLAYLKDGPYELTQELKQADCVLVLSGMYLTYGYAEAIEAELEQAKALGIPVLTAAPHGTPYIPMKLRGFSAAHCNLDRDSVLAMLEKAASRLG